MSNRFREWLRCPACEASDVGVLAHAADVVLECYECGEIAEFTLGRDVPFANVDSDAVSTSDGTSGGASADE